MRPERHVGGEKPDRTPIYENPVCDKTHTERPSAFRVADRREPPTRSMVGDVVSVAVSSRCVRGVHVADLVRRVDVAALTSPLAGRPAKR
jgi:hypothetical protein